jgi:hypothetical protein
MGYDAEIEAFRREVWGLVLLGGLIGAVCTAVPLFAILFPETTARYLRHMGILKKTKRSGARKDRRVEAYVAAMKDSERYTGTMADGTKVERTGAEWKKEVGRTKRAH